MTHNEITIDAPAEVVFPYISEGDKIALWSKDDRLEISFPRGTEARVGMQIQFMIRFPTEPSWTIEIRELIDNQRIVTEAIDGIFRGSINFTLKPSGKKTLLIHDAIIIPQGSFMRFAWKTAGEKIHRDKMEEIMLRIKKIVEEKR